MNNKVIIDFSEAPDYSFLDQEPGFGYIPKKKPSEIAKAMFTATHEHALIGIINMLDKCDIPLVLKIKDALIATYESQNTVGITPKIKIQVKTGLFSHVCIAHIVRLAQSIDENDINKIIVDIATEQMSTDIVDFDPKTYQDQVELMIHLRWITKNIFNPEI